MVITQTCRGSSLARREWWCRNRFPVPRETKYVHYKYKWLTIYMKQGFLVPCICSDIRCFTSWSSMQADGKNIACFLGKGCVIIKIFEGLAMWVCCVSGFKLLNPINGRFCFV